MMKGILLVAIFNLISLTGFGQCPGGTIFLMTQTDIDNFSTNYPGCTQPVRLTISGNGISNLNGLSQITGIQENILIQEMSNLVDFNGLHNLTVIGEDFDLWHTGVLNFQGLSSLTTVDGEITISQNHNLLDFSGLTSLINISGIQALQSNPAFRISFNDSLTSLTGLEGLGDIGIGLIITNNISLLDLNGLDNLSMIEGRFFIQDNPQIESLLGLNNLSFINGGFTIIVNNSLQNLTGIESLVQINGSLFIASNANLNSINGLSNLQANSVMNTIAIANNPFLPLCNIMAVCDNLDNPDISFIIENNATGCNNVQEVENSCLLSVNDTDLNKFIYAFPNPVSEILQIQISGGIKLEKVNVYSLSSEYLISTSEENIDLTTLSAGIYFVEIVTDQGNITKKIIKQ